MHLARYKIDAILRDHDEVLLDLVDLLDKARELVAALHEHLLIRITVLTEEGLVRGSVDIIVEQDRLILLNCKLSSL